MRVLWVTPHFPDAQGTGGGVHQFELLRYVSTMHDVTVLTSDWSIHRRKLQAVRELGVRVRTVPWPWHIFPAKNRLSKLFHLMRGASPSLIAWRAHRRLGPLADALAAEERERPVDLVCVVMGDIAPILGAARAPTALLLFDVYSRLTEIKAGDRLSPSALRRWLERRNASAWEPRWYRLAGEIACVTSIDAELISAMLGRSVFTIPNPIPDELFSEPEVPRSDNIVTFVGSFSWEPNTDAVHWICEEIWPLVLRRRPDARLRVVGRYAFPELRKAVEAAGGELFADVEDIRPYYWEAAAVIAPIRMGSGMRNKVLHAMACGAPVVATRTSLEGIPAVAGEQLLVADDSAGLADAVVEILNDPAAAAARVEAAREIPVRYSAAESGAAFEAWWRAAAAKRATAPDDGPAPERPSLTATVVVCTKDRPEVLRRSLPSVAAAVQTVPGTELIVVEQGAPAAAGICSELGLAATVVPDDGTGVSRARNRGLQRERGDAVLYTDDDCEVPIDWVRGHLEALAGPEVGASFGEVSGLTRWGDEGADHAALPSRHRAGSPPWLIGHSSNMAALCAALRSVGGFDERLGPGSVSRASGEDADLIVRMLRAGWLLASGTGQPVRHIEWRSSPEHRSLVVSYEHGAGVWIGKALRERPRAALGLLRWRVAHMRDAASNGKTTGDNSVPLSTFAAALTRGLLTGLRMKPWPGPSPDGPVAHPAAPHPTAKRT